MQADTDMSSDLLERLEASLESYTPAEQAIANFILTNRGGIAFETASSIATKLQVSSITVGRFARKMGYRHFKDLKTGLRTTMSGVPWLVGDQLTEFVGGVEGSHRTKQSLELELAGIIEVYAMAGSAEWRQVVALLAHSRHVHVAGFQTERGVATTLAHLLQYAREGVSMVDMSAGNYHDVLAADPEGRCLVLVDLRRYSDQCRDLAAAASRMGIPVIMLTDKFCDWVRKYTNHVITVSTEVELFWSSQVSLSCAVNLLVNDVIGELGTAVGPRLERLSALYQNHTGHVGSHTPQRS